MPTATLTTKGQITLPKEVREHLRLATGDKLEFTLDEGRTARVRRRGKSVRELAGLLRRPGMPPVTLEEMKEGMLAYLSEDDERIRRGGR
jgi:AbrB family looped-hinge helix DNA binding protein